MENFYTQIKNIVSKSSTNKIAIIGKGPSISKLNLDILKKDYIIINLNDSERIIAGEFAILHRAWSYQSVKDNGFKSAHYISDIAFSNGKNTVVKYKPDTYDSIEQTLKRFDNSEIYITDFLFITAIKLAMEIAKVLDKKMTLYFLGFDFSLGKTSNSIIENDYAVMDELNFKKVFLKTQEEYFIASKKYFAKNDKHIEIIHVGEKSYSDLSIESFNNQELIAKIAFSEIPANFNTILYNELLNEVKTNGKTLIVAELTNNHLGDVDRLKEMVRLSKKAGADLIKVQKRNVETFYNQEELASEYDSPYGKTLRDYRTAVELDDAMFEILAIACYKNKIAWFASILDEESLHFIAKYDCPLLKIPSTISNHRNYIQKFAQTYTGDVVVSTGFTDSSYEKFILNLFKDSNKTLWLLQCTSSYPAPADACQISVVRHYHDLHKSKYPNVLAGYSSHDIGSLGCMMAVASGAKMVEKHVKLGNVVWVHFDGVALDLYHDNFKKFVSDVRKAQIMCGSEIKTIHQNEHHKYKPNETHN